MSHHIDFQKISWEQFEDLCVDLWFDEGYTDIKPMGRRREGGRDAIYIEESTNELTIFQFKCWTTNYDTSKLKSMIKKATEKIVKFNPQKFILNSAHVPNATVNDWINVLSENMGFTIEYWDRSWIDLRLDNSRQDLRQKYFRLDLSHHTWHSLRSASLSQIRQAMKSFSGPFKETICVKRKEEEKFSEFIQSNKTGLGIIARSGNGKTNFVCHLALELHKRNEIVFLIRGDTTIHDDNGLEKMVISALGYETSSFHTHFNNVTELLISQKRQCYVFIDGLSEADDLSTVNRSLRNLLIHFADLGCFKLIFTCRDTSWTHITYGLLENETLFISDSSNGNHPLIINEFNEEELMSALPLYKNEFGLDFSPVEDAINQLKNPLLLRLFCESNSNQDLGKISAIPIAQTFEKYLATKAKSIEYRSGRRYSLFQINELLRDIVGEMWLLGDRNSLHEDQWRSIFSKFTHSEQSELLLLLTEEGLIKIDQETIPFEGSLSFTFDKLQEYLLVQFFLSRLPKERLKVGDINQIALTSLKNIPKDTYRIEDMKFFSLIGMLLPDITKRRRFLNLLLKWDFQTYCACLANIPPTGNINSCTYQSLESLARELRRWYRDITSTIFPDDVCSIIDPWEWESSKKKKIGIKLIASPECKEISYGYTLLNTRRKPKDQVSVEQISSYPTWEISIGTRDNRIQLHDPDNGIIIPIYRRSRDDFMEYTRRTINYSLPLRFPGDSINVPERMALYDVFNEVQHLLMNLEKIFPLIPTPIAEEAEQESNISQIEDFNDEELFEYLKEIFIKAISSYRLLVRKYFNQFEGVLNLSAQLPCKIAFVTDRISVRYWFIPMEGESDAIPIMYRILDSKFDISSPKWEMTIKNDIEDQKPRDIDEYVQSELSRLGKLRPTINPIEKVVALDDFFGKTPIKNLVLRWLITDFHSVFSL